MFYIRRTKYKNSKNKNEYKVKQYQLKQSIAHILQYDVNNMAGVD